MKGRMVRNRQRERERVTKESERDREREWCGHWCKKLMT